MNLRELREKRAQAAGRITELANRLAAERRDFSAEEQSNWEAANAEYDRLGRDVQTAERAEQVRKEQGRPVGDPDVGREDSDPRARRRDRVQATEGQRSLAFRAWAKRQLGLGLRREEREACRALRFDPRSPELRVQLWADRHRNDVQRRLASTAGESRADILRKESRASLSAQAGPSGAYMVAPGSLSSALETNLLAFGGVRQVAEVMTTATGEPFFWPTVDDTSNSGALLGENTSVGAGVNPTIGVKRWDAYKFSSKPILVPTELLEDTSYDLPAYIGELLGTRLGRGTAPYYATGTGGSQPEGIVTGSSLGKTTSGATAITFDELVDLVHSVDPAYRSMPGVGWLMHDGIVQYIRKIKDSSNRPLWTNGEFWNSGMKDGVPDRLFGHPVNICQEMQSTVATATKTILFGLLSKYKIRQVRDVRLYRLQERYRDLDQDGFIAFVREDGKLLDAGTAPVKHMLQA